MKKITNEEFIIKSKEIHGNKYDYSKVKYEGSLNKVCLICPKHGEFWQSAYKHIKGQGCKKCVNEKESLTTEEFIKKSKEIHGDKYDYSKVEYINAKTKVCIICPIHGEFFKSPEAHYKQKQGCPKCNGYNNTQTDFIEKSKEIHGNKYDYSKVNYINQTTKVCIICPTHGEFWQKPTDHLSGKGCKQCANESNANNKRKTQESFIKEAKEVHGNKYDYSKVNYINCYTKIKITCPIHGEFFQTPQMHKQGQGCPKCKASKLENEINLWLTNKKIVFEEQKRFKWLGKQSLDFYLPEYNAAIECQGEQHFKPIKLYGGEEGFKRRQELDNNKKIECEKHGIKIIYYTNLKGKKPYNIINDKEELWQNIKSK